MPVEAVARLRYVSIPPRKMRLVADLVRGLPIEEALGILNFTPRIAARHVAKTLKSAAANALSIEGTAHLHPEDLYVSEIIVQEAPAYKRIRFQSMGRVFRYKKRHCHLTVKLAERPDAVAARARAKSEAEKKPKTKRTAKTAAGKPSTGKKPVAGMTATKKKAVSKTAKKTANRTSAKKKTANGADG